MKKNFSKLLALYLPYLLLGLAATNFGEAWRLAEGKEMGDRILSLMGTIPAAFANPLLSLHPLDILVGMLNQANGDRQILAKQLNISPHQLSYVTHSGEGEGLLFYGNTILPFIDRFPHDLELYKIMTTRLSEVSEGDKS